MTRRKTIPEVLSKFQQVWGNTYDYSLISDYKNNGQKLPIICRKHGVFYQSFAEHSKHHGCPKCADERTSERCKLTYLQFIYRAKEIHGNKYEYSLITQDNYVDTHNKVPILCKEHGVFFQTPNQHLRGRGCYWCGKKSMAKAQAYTVEELISIFHKIFNGKYDYSLFTEYHRKKDKIKVICPKHGIFEVSVDNHLYKHSGCPKCKRSFGEERIAKFLQEQKIDFTEQHGIPNEMLFCENKKLIVDFFLPRHNTIIEYQGIQHYKEIQMFDTRNFEQQQERDNAVRQYCKEHKIKLIEIPYTEYDNIEEILTKKLKVK